MMKKVFTFLILMLLFFISNNSIFSQSGWIRQNSNINDESTKIYFINHQTGWVTTNSNKILKTSDGGNNWTIQILPVSSYNIFYDIYFLNENTGWICGGFYYFVNTGYLLKTTNGGENWFSSGGYGGIYTSIHFINEITGFLAIDNSGDFGSNGTIVKTTNGGINWTSVNVDNNYFYLDIKFINEIGIATGRYWDDIGRDSLLILKSTDLGNSWDQVFRESGEFFSPHKFGEFQIIDNHIWCLYKGSKLLHSSDDGINWNVQFINENSQRLNSVYFINHLTGWVAGFRDGDTTNIFKTTTGGSDWFAVRNPYPNWLNSIYFINDQTGWVSGSNYPEPPTIILRTTTGGITFINQSIANIPTEFSLHQNYPNPFNPVTNIKFSLPTTQYTILQVFDIAGREVATLVNEKLQAGSYEFTFDANQLSSGIYFYQLKTDEFVQSRKMVLTK